MTRSRLIILPTYTLLREMSIQNNLSSRNHQLRDPDQLYGKQAGGIALLLRG